MPVNAPAGTNDYVYPGLIEQKESAAIDRAEQEARGEITNPIVRDIIPYLDFDAGADTSWSGDTDTIERKLLGVNAEKRGRRVGSRQ